LVAAATLRRPALRAMRLVVAIIYYARLMEPKKLAQGDSIKKIAASPRASFETDGTLILNSL
jgi:hypothetical protein